VQPDVTTAILGAVDAVDERVARATPVDWRRVIRALLLVVPLLFGYVVGRVRLITRYAVGAFVEGMERGMTSAAGEPAHTRTPG